MSSMNEPIEWDSAGWLQRFAEAASERDYFHLHDLRIQVYANTLSAVHAGGYRCEDGTVVQLEQGDDMVRQTRFYSEEIARDTTGAGTYRTVIEAVNVDCLVFARELVAAGHEVCVLNLANRHNPGGGVVNGAGAQEEYLFRCSDYYRSLYQFVYYGPSYGVECAAESYPMDRDFGGIYTPGVTIFRGPEEQGYPFIAEPRKVNMIAVAAINRPDTEMVDGELRITPCHQAATLNKIRTILSIAKANKQKVLVLGALGCGAFRNPPRHIAELFREALHEPAFNGVFERVYFAIKEDHNSRGRGNFAPFREVFSAPAQVELTMLGTGNAAVTRCYNTCFTIRNGAQVLLVDAGGGNGILARLEQAGVPLAAVHDVFLTHTHTDHILGVVWVLRMVAQAMNAGKYSGELHLYGHAEGLQALETICRLTLPGKVCRHLHADILLHALADGAEFTAAGMRGQAFDIGSTKARQYGFALQLPDGRRLCCLGDEPYNERAELYARGADWLLCEAFCLYADRERFKPYEKHHSTALDAGRLAAGLDVRNLLLYHTEDKTLATRRDSYTAEAAEHFTGVIHVPDDMEHMLL